MTSPRFVARQIQFEGEDFTLLFDWEAIAEYEEGTGVSIGDTLKPPAGGTPMLSRLAKLLRAGLRRHHPDLDLNTAGAMMSDPEVMEQFLGAVAASQAQPGDAEEAGSAAPGNRKARRAEASPRAGKTG